MDLPVAILIVLGGAAVALLAFTLVRRAASGPVMLDSGRGRPMVTVTGTTFDRLDLRSPREQAGFQDLLNQAATRTTGRQERLSDDTPTVPTPLWVTLVFGGAVAVALNLGMADPREKLYVHGVMMAGIAA